MIKTAIEWYTLDEKLPYDGKILWMDDRTDILCQVEIKIGSSLYLTYIDQLDWSGGKIVQMLDGEYVDVTDSVKYWAYIPEIGE